MNICGKSLRVRTALLALVFAVLASSASTFAEDGSLPDAPKANTHPAEAYGANRATFRELVGNVIHDQGAIWTSPLRIRAHDLVWLLPLGAASGVAIATDQQTMRDIISHDPSLNNSSTTASNVAIGGMIAAPVAIYGIGYLRHDDHARETGVLGSEAMLDGVVVEQGMKLIFWRERPYMDGGRGKFWQGSVGIDSSFPSSHAVIAWSAASVMAAEYPRPLAQIGIYTAATGVSLARLMGQQHFPGDLLVGSAAGWLVGHYVYKHRHRYDTGRHPVEHAMVKVAEVIQ